MAQPSAGIYARISSDEDGTHLGVTRQVQDCSAEADRRGWGVVDRYVDNDVSATRAKIRPEYQRMLADIKSGRINALIVWDVDRLTRTPRELEDIIDLADRHGLDLASVGGEIDLSTPQGRLTARLKGSVARHEAEQMSRRIRRKFDERAENGAPHGAPAYGYQRLDQVDDNGRKVGVRDELDPEQAAVIRQVATRLLAGESVRALASDLNRRGLTPPRSAAWSSTTLRQMLLRDRNAGLRRHRGKVIGDAAWPPIYDAGTHDRVVALLTDPNRRSNKGSERKHLLSGIARCGREGCDGRMVRNVGRSTGDGKRQPPAYVCSTCFRVKRKQDDVDRLVETIIVARLQQPDAVASLALGDPGAAQQATDQIAKLEARLQRAADDYADDVLTREQLHRITAKLRPQIDAARTERTRAEPSSVLAGLTGTDAEARWGASSLEVRRAVIEVLCTVTIMPSGPGRSFDPAMIEIEFSSGD